MFTLGIVVLVTSLQQPKEHVGLRVHMPYDTQYTCENASNRIDGEAVGDIVTHALKYEKRHITVRKVVIECLKGNPSV
jgi:hypothetical protein